MYTTMTQIEINRCKSDKMYRCIIDRQSPDLSLVISSMLRILEETFHSDEMSCRLKRILVEVSSTKDRVAKHAFLFFALNELPKTQLLFLNEKDQFVPPEKFTRFVLEELPKLCEKLLTGSFTSLRGFTEDCRWIYMTL